MGGTCWQRGGASGFFVGMLVHGPTRTSAFPGEVFRQCRDQFGERWRDGAGSMRGDAAGLAKERGKLRTTQAARIKGFDECLLLLVRIAEPPAPVGFHNHFIGFIHIVHSGTSMTDMNESEQIPMNGASDPAYSSPPGLPYWDCPRRDGA